MHDPKTINFTSKAVGFCYKLNFPNCISDFNGIHNVRIKSFSNSGSLTITKIFSILLRDISF